MSQKKKLKCEGECKGLITGEEILKALQSMQNKSAGNDGLSREFCETF